MGSIPKLSPIFSVLYKPQKILFQYFSSSTGIYLCKNAKKLKTFYRYHNNSAPYLLDHCMMKAGLNTILDTIQKTTAVV